MAEQDTEKTEMPTPRRLAEARQDGQVARSPDLTAAASLLAAVILLHFFGLELMAGMKTTIESLITSQQSANPTRADDLGAMFVFIGRVAFTAAAPLLVGVLLAALLSCIGQVGFLFTAKPLELDFTKLSPLRGFRNLVNGRAAMRLAMSVAKIAVIGALSAWVVLNDIPKILLLSHLTLMPLFGVACQLVYGLALKLAALLVVLAIIDYAYQRWQHMNDLKMSKQEIKEELKRMEGDPLVKQRRSRVARQLALQRINQAVPKADVVVTNPTHYAIALQYDGATMRAPKVIAKGADYLALRIRQLAMAHSVPMVERRELAQALYRQVEVGQEIPPQYFNAVAEILAYVYRLSGRKTA